MATSAGDTDLVLEAKVADISKPEPKPEEGAVEADVSLAADVSLPTDTVSAANGQS